MLVIAQWMLSGWCPNDWEQNRNQNTGQFHPPGELSPPAPIRKGLCCSSVAFFWSLHCAFLSTEQHRCNRKNGDMFSLFHTFVWNSTPAHLMGVGKRESISPHHQYEKSWDVKVPSISYFIPLISRASVDLSSETHFLHLRMQEALGAPTDMFADA